MNRGQRLLAVFLLILAAASAQADVLSDAQLYFDPDSISPDYYERIELPDLGQANSHTWLAGNDPVTDADILPVLKPGSYPPGYSFSQNDYYLLPNVNYFGDLTGGTLTARFAAPGLYHVRVTRQSGSHEVFAVFAESWLKEVDGDPDKTGAVRELDPPPDGDLFLVENSDQALDNSAAIWQKAGRYVRRVDRREPDPNHPDDNDVITEIIMRWKKLGRKIHVEIDGHGTAGRIGTGAGKGNIPDKQIDLNSVGDLAHVIRHYVSQITFQGCRVGKGAKGQYFLDTLAKSIGYAGAWDSPVVVVDQDHFEVDRNAEFVEVVMPEPASLLLLAIGELILRFPVGARR
jgi:hypothetical protein